MRNRNLFVSDILLLAFTPVLALILRGEDISRFVYSQGLVVYTALALIIKLLVLSMSGIYARYWRYASVDELFLLVFAAFVSCLALFLINLAVGQLRCGGAAAPDICSDNRLALNDCGNRRP